MTTDDILLRAGRAFAELDRAQAAVRAAEAKLSSLRREYDLATGTRGLRVESLRNLVEARYSRFRKIA